MAKEELGRAVELLRNKLKDHIGSGDEAHAIASKYNPGFLGTQDRNKFMAAFGQRLYAENGSDIETLAPGRYWGTGFKNSVVPADNGTITFVDITGSDDGNQKDYRIVTSYNGRVYYKTHHVNADGVNSGAPLGFGEIHKFYTLWEGSQSDVNAQITLSDYLPKYSQVAITYESDAVTRQTSVFDNVNKISIEATNVYDDPKTPGFSSYEMAIALSGKAITITNNRKLNVISGSVSDVDDNDRIRIRKVVGIA